VQTFWMIKLCFKYWKYKKKKTKKWNWWKWKRKNWNIAMNEHFGMIEKFKVKQA